MEFSSTIALILHLVGVAAGAGGALAADGTFLRTVWNRKISKDQLALIEIVSKIVVGGLLLLIASGAFLVYLNPHYLSLDGTSSVFWTKMTIVAILSANGYVFHKVILPLLRRHEGKDFASDEVKHKLWLLALTGGLSGVSWYSVLALGVLMQMINLPYLFLINLYLLLVLGAVLSAFVMLYWILFYKKDAKRQTALAKTKTKTKTLGTYLRPVNQLMITVGAFVLLAALIYSASLMSRAEEHFVCISEAPPWFTPEVLEIKPGDTVVWHHCGEDEIDYSQYTSLFIQPVYAHEDEADEHDENGGHVHTHPIYSISGPEHFSSDMGVVGHLDDGLEFRHTFEEEGIYEYICPTHPYMKGIIAVGEEAPVDSLWPPNDDFDESELLSAPEVPGIGEIWLNTQFEHIDGQPFPGSITVLDAATWETTDIITDEHFNNPHNLWNTYDNRYIFQTQWHSDKVSKIDIDTKEVVGTVTLGNAPAHLFVHPDPDKDRIYVTLNNESRVIVLNSDLETVNEIETSFGPHGVWIDPSGKWMSVAATLESKLDIIDLDREEVVHTFDAPGLPLATQITNDSRYAMVSLLLEGRVRFIDLDTMEIAADVEVGQLPIWAMPDPSGDYVFVPNTGSGDVSVIALDTLEVVTTLPAAAGAHGIVFGEKEGGGYYGYVSNKYARVVTVIDLDRMETLGHIRLHDGAWGGNGILTLPNNYAEFIAQ